jgi:hypothetical protein
MMLNRHVVFASAALVVSTCAATAHHSFAMFDQGHPIELVGTVKEFKFASPHTFILLEVKGQDAPSVVWNLEGNSPNSLAWGGWSSQTLRPGYEVRITIEPLRSGAPGGAWNPKEIRFMDGTVIVPAP